MVEMIFVLAKNEPKIFLMLSEKDVQNLRNGHTINVDERQLKSSMFNGVILCLNRTDDDSLDLIRRAGHATGPLATQQPYPHQMVCKDCKGNIDTVLLVEDRCFACWVVMAKKLQTAGG
jgi:hypothetical protein